MRSDVTSPAMWKTRSRSQPIAAPSTFCRPASPPADSMISVIDFRRLVRKVASSGSLRLMPRMAKSSLSSPSLTRL